MDADGGTCIGRSTVRGLLPPFGASYCTLVDQQSVTL
jgi:hypothetical protein